MTLEIILKKRPGTSSLGISFLNPTSKGQRRFPKALKAPVPPIDHDLWKEIQEKKKEL